MTWPYIQISLESVRLTGNSPAALLVDVGQRTRVCGSILFLYMVYCVIIETCITIMGQRVTLLPTLMFLPQYEGAESVTVVSVPPRVLSD